MKGFRIEAGLDRGEPIEFQCDGETVAAYAGESIAAALLVAGRCDLRRTGHGERRGLYCGMGVCWECAVTVNGVANVRSCMTPVVAGLIVETGRGGAAD